MEDSPCDNLLSLFFHHGDRILPSRYGLDYPLFSFTILKAHTQLANYSHAIVIECTSVPPGTRACTLRTAHS